MPYVPGSRWWATNGETHCVEVVADHRRTRSVRLHYMNILAPRQRCSRRVDEPGGNTFSLAEFEARFRPTPRIDIAWINIGSVWRRLPTDRSGYSHQGGYGSDYTNFVGLKDLVVVSDINSGGYVSLRRIPAEGVLVPYGFYDVLGNYTVTQFMQHYCRVWDIAPPRHPDDEYEVFPGLLHVHGLLTPASQPKPETPSKKKRKPPRKRKRPSKRRSVWERLMADD